MRKPLVAGNWKMNGTAQTVRDYFAAFGEAPHGVDVALCLPYPYLALGVESADVSIGAQDVFWMDKGAFTGSISVGMLSDLGVQYCIVGHSETRGKFGKLEIEESTLGYFSETDETVNLKIKALLDTTITPILCVGETLAEREANRTDAIIQAQLANGLSGIDDLGSTVIAYEPVWAIGTGKTCDTAEAQRVCKMIRDWVRDNRGNATADAIRIQYGGSVKSANAADLFGQPDIDGGLVGGASLDPAEFKMVVEAAIA